MLLPRIRERWMRGTVSARQAADCVVLPWTDESTRRYARLRGVSSMRSAILIVAALTAVGCSRSETPVADSSTTPSTTASTEPAATPPPDHASAAGNQHRVNLMPGLGGQVAGALDLVSSDGAVVVTGLITGLAPDSEHGFHIHEKGDCSSPDFKSAGEHFNPTMEPHGNPATPPHHLGDVPNVKANNEGKADVNARVEGVTLGDGGANDVVGKAFVVHAKLDDYMTQPSGNSGDRIACGVIE
jgi:superoxide dismutase, Cu-Zn family